MEFLVLIKPGPEGYARCEPKTQAEDFHNDMLASTTQKGGPKMKKMILIMLPFLALGLGSNAFGQKATPISRLPYTISKSGSYAVTKNLTSSQDGIIVGADDVTIDLMGFRISGPDSGFNYGISMEGRSNVEVRNGTVANFGSIGISEAGGSGSNHRIINVRVKGNGASGIFLFGSNHLVKDCTVSDNQGFGIFVQYGSVVNGSTTYNNTVDGISSTIGSTITGNTAYNNGSHGIGGCQGCTIIGNALYSNEAMGIYTLGGCTIKNNAAYSNHQEGIYSEGYSLIDGNTAWGNTSGNIHPCATCTMGLNAVP